MKNIHLLKISTSSYDANKELKDKKIDKLVHATKCYVLAKIHEPPKHEAPDAFTMDDLIDSYHSKFSSKQNSYENELQYIFKAIINYLPLYVGHNAIEIITTKANINKALGIALTDLTRYLQSTDAASEYHSSTINDFVDYIAFDLVIFKTNTKFGQIFLEYAPDLISSLMACNVKAKFNVSKYTYKSYHRCEMTDINIEKYTKAGKVDATYLMQQNTIHKIDAELSNKVVKAVMTYCDVKAGYSDRDVFKEIKVKREYAIEGFKNKGDKILDICCILHSKNRHKRIINIIKNLNVKLGKADIELTSEQIEGFNKLYDYHLKQLNRLKVA